MKGNGVMLGNSVMKLVLLVVVVQVSRPSAAAMGMGMGEPSCPRVVEEVTPCLNFLHGAAKPSERCCQGVKEVGGMAKTKKDRTAICECLKKTLRGIHYDPKRIPALGKSCASSINLPPIDHTTNCNDLDPLYL